jgi:hypothetical protein
MVSAIAGSFLRAKRRILQSDKMLTSSPTDLRSTQGRITRINCIQVLAVICN